MNNPLHLQSEMSLLRMLLIQQLMTGSQQQEDPSQGGVPPEPVYNVPGEGTPFVNPLSPLLLRKRRRGALGGLSLQTGAAGSRLGGAGGGGPNYSGDFSPVH